MNKLAPALGGEHNKAFVAAGNAPMMSGAWYATLDLDELIALMDARQRRLFACDCAERALSYLDKPDGRSMNAVRVGRRYAEGAATELELTVAREAAWAAARVASINAWVIPGDVSWSVERDELLRIAGDVARVAPKLWQKQRAIWYLSGEGEINHG